MDALQATLRFRALGLGGGHCVGGDDRLALALGLFPALALGLFRVEQ
jgi:hypothetical protein